MEANLGVNFDTFWDICIRKTLNIWAEKGIKEDLKARRLILSLLMSLILLLSKKIKKLK